MNKTINDIKQDVFAIYETGGIKADASRFIRSELGLKETQSKHWAKILYEEYEDLLGGGGDVDEGEKSESLESEPKTVDNDLEYQDKYVYDKEKDKYIFLLENRLGKNMVLDGCVVRSMVKNYSNFDDTPLTINEVSVRYKIPRNYLLYILKILGVTHDSLPFTPEDYQDRDPDELVKEAITEKRFSVHQKIQRQFWKDTKESAKKWDEFVVGKFNPFVEAINNWSPPEFPSVVSSNKKKPSGKTDDTLLVVLTDTHIGKLTKNSWNGEVFDTHVAVDNIFSYLSQIEEELDERKTRITKCKLVLMGDILNSCIDGKTRHETELTNDIINEDMFRVGLDVVVSFITGLNGMFDNIDIHCVKGNHDSIMIYGVYYAALKYFEKNDAVNWHISDYWLDSFRINDCYFIYTHGKDDKHRTSLPKNRGKNLESYIQSLLLSKLHELQNIDSKYFITGHLHSYEHVEMNDFDFIQVPASVNADSYEDGLGYRQNAKQNAFVVGKGHIKNTLHFRF